MNSSQSDLDALRRLVAWKRHEKPPPGYFNHFSDRVIARIEVEQFDRSLSWWNWLLEKLETKPILACACGLAVSSLLLLGFRLSEVFQIEAAEVPFARGIDLVSAPAQRTYSGVSDADATLDRPGGTYSTSLSPSFRSPHVADYFRGNRARVQTASFGYSQ